VGLESTIIGLDNERIVQLRPGGLAIEDIEAITGYSISPPTKEGITAPGQMPSHYAPNSQLRLNAHEPNAGEAYLAFGQSENSPNTLNLSLKSDLREASANLFAHLRRLDLLVQQQDLSGISVAQIPNEGLGHAINDRLQRAAAPR